MIVIDIANVRMHDATLHDDRSLAELEPQVVQRVEVQRKTGFNVAPRRLISLITIGWNTMTSPWSSLIMATRAPSRFSSDICSGIAT